MWKSPSPAPPRRPPMPKVKTKRIRRHPLRVCFCMGLWLAVLLFARVDPAAADIVDDFWTTTRSGAAAISLTEDNDAFVPGVNSDQEYTSGLRIQYTFLGRAYLLDESGQAHELEAGSDGTAAIIRHGKPVRIIAGKEEGLAVSEVGYLRFRLRQTPGEGNSQLQARLTNYGFAIGQEIYTPRNTRAYEPLPDERPYGGWLYFGAFVQTATNEGAYYNIELDIGCIGPCAMADMAQGVIHKYLVYSSVAQGWKNQVSNEPGAMLGMEARKVLFEYPAASEYEHRNVEISYFAKGSLGNIFMDTSVGFSLRLGAFHTDFASMGAPGRAATRVANEGEEREQKRNWSLARSLNGGDDGGPKEMFLLVRLEGKMVLHNGLLQGGMSSANEIHTVSPSRFLVDGEAGLVAHYNSLRILFSIRSRSTEFEKDQWSPTRHVYGRFQITFFH